MICHTRSQIWGGKATGMLYIPNSLLPDWHQLSSVPCNTFTFFLLTELIDEQHTSNNNWQCKHYIATLPLPGGGKGPRRQRLMSLGCGYVFFSFLFSLFLLITKILDTNTTTHYLVHYQPHINKSTIMEQHHVVNTWHQHHYHWQINKSTTMGWRHVVNMWLPPTPEMMNLRGSRCRIMDAPRARYVFLFLFLIY